MGVHSVVEMGAKGSGSGGNLKTGNGSVWHGHWALCMGAGACVWEHLRVSMGTEASNLSQCLLLGSSFYYNSPPYSFPLFFLLSLPFSTYLLCCRHLLLKHPPILISPLTQSEISSPLFLPLFLPQFSPFFLPIPSPLPFAPLPARGMVRAYPRSLGCTD